MEFSLDDETFEAALSFVDEYEFDADAAVVPGPDNKKAVNAAPGGKDGAFSSLVETTRSKTRALKADKEKKRTTINERKRLLRRAGVYGDPNRARKERTREIADLREQLAKLQIDLRALKTGENLQQVDGAAHRAASALVVGVRPRSTVSGMWEDLAVRQRHRREAAERDNGRLRLAVERQQKVAASLKDLMQKRASQLESECSTLVTSALAQSPVFNVLDFHGDVREFEGLFRRLDTAYREFDAVFEANGLAKMETSSTDVHLREGADGKYLEFFTHKVLPFGQRATAEATWDHYKGSEKHMGSGYLYEKTAKDLDEPYTIIEEFTKEIYSNNARADVRMKQVVRRYVEDDRDFVIWVTRVSPVEIKHKMLQGLTYHIRGYALSKRSPASTPEHELSQFQLCTLVTLDRTSCQLMYGPENLRMLTNFLIVYTAQNVRFHRDGIENILIDQAMRQKYNE